MPDTVGDIEDVAAAKDTELTPPPPPEKMSPLHLAIGYDNHTEVDVTPSCDGVVSRCPAHVWHRVPRSPLSSYPSRAPPSNIGRRRPFQYHALIFGGGTCPSGHHEAAVKNCFPRGDRQRRHHRGKGEGRGEMAFGHTQRDKGRVQCHKGRSLTLWIGTGSRCRSASQLIGFVATRGARCEADLQSAIAKRFAGLPRHSVGNPAGHHIGSFLMQLDEWPRSPRETARQGFKQCVPSSVQCDLMHYVQRSIHQPREIARYEEAFADQESHETADRRVLSKRDQGAEVAICVGL
jgi:hypothetical protein